MGLGATPAMALGRTGAFAVLVSLVLSAMLPETAAANFTSQGSGSGGEDTPSSHLSFTGPSVLTSHPTLPTITTLPSLSSLPPSPSPLSQYPTLSPSLSSTRHTVTLNTPHTSSSTPPLITTSTQSPSPPPPLPSPSVDMALDIDPTIYLIAVPVAVGLLLIIILILICWIIVFVHRRRKKRLQTTSQSFKHRSGSIPQPKSLQAYSGNGPHSVGKTADGSAKRYELQTLDSTSRVTAASPTATVPAHHTHSANTQLLTHSDTGWTNSHISSLPREHPSSSEHSAKKDAVYTHKVQRSNSVTVAPPGTKMPTRYQKPGPQLARTGERYVKMVPAKSASLAVLEAAEGYEPTSLYDVPTSSLIQGPSSVPDTSDGPLSMYDTPKSALIASGHYKVPPLAFGEALSPEGVYDVPPSASSVYDVPPLASSVYDVPPSAQSVYNVPPLAQSVYDVPPLAQSIYDVPPDAFNQGSDLYDVPPSSVPRPRLSSQPTSLQELVEARRSVTCGSPGSDNVFTGVPDYSHYDVPKHLLMAYRGEDKQPSSQGAKGHSRRNSNPSHVRNAMIYDVPRKALLADTSTDLFGPPTAPKPSKKGQTESSAYSPLETASLERKPHPNAAFYDVAPLDASFFAQRQGYGSTTADSDTVHLAMNSEASPHAQLQAPRRTASKKRKIPPPTRSKPGKR